MFGHIYKLADGKYHLCGRAGNKTECGTNMNTISEDRIFGQKGNEYYPDPSIEEVCSKCFHFLPEFNRL